MKKMLLATALCALSANANASEIISLPGGTPLPVPAVNLLGTSATQTLAPGITASPSSDFAFGYTGGYGFSSNGSWSGTSMIGLDQANGFFTIDFTSPVQAFLGELNWTKGISANNATIQIYGLSGLLESLTLENGAGNTVAPGFRGFSRTSNEITSVRFSNEYIGVRNITTLTSAVPEPATWLMLVLGFGFIGAAIRRKPSTVRVSFG